EDAFLDPGAQRSGTVPADEVQQPASGIADHPVDHASQVRVAAYPDMLEHPHRHEHIRLSRDVPVIVFDELDPAVQSLFPCPPPRIHGLLMREIEGFDSHTIVSGHVKRQASPAETGLRYRLPGLQPKFAADV